MFTAYSLLAFIRQLLDHLSKCEQAAINITTFFETRTLGIENRWNLTIFSSVFSADFHIKGHTFHAASHNNLKLQLTFSSCLTCSLGPSQIN